MANNVSFLRGPQSNLESLESYIAGAFYLTEDTDRLYFAQTDSELVYLNKHITTVANIDSLPAIAAVNTLDFYYAIDENILCTKATDEATDWTQVNAQNPEITVSKIEVSDGSLNETKDVLTFNVVLTQTDGDNETTVNDTFSVSQATLRELVSFDPENDVANVAISTEAVEGNDSQVAIKLSGNGSNSTENSIQLEKGDNIDLTVSGDVIRVSGVDTKYTLSTNTVNGAAAIIAKDSETENEQAISFKSSDNTIVVSADGANNSIDIKHKVYGIPSNTDVTTNPAFGSEISIVSPNGVENGHITSTKTHKIKLPEISSVGLNTDGKIQVVVKDGANNESTIASEQTVYTRAEVDNKFSDHLKTVNALTYKGGTSELPTSASIGDTWIVESVFTVGEKTASAGDLIIASGAEGENGVITGDITWTVIPATETDTTYEMIANANVANSETVDNSVVVTTTLKASSGDDTASSFNLASESLEITGSGSTANINLVWGTF